MHLVAQLSNQNSDLLTLVHRLGSPHTREERLSCDLPPMPKHVLLTPTEIADLAARFQNGTTIQEAADAFGVHRTTARTHLIKLGLWPRKL